jgi:hypothetical protein
MFNLMGQTGLQNEVCQQLLQMFNLMGQTGLLNEVCRQLITNVQPDGSNWFAERSLPTIRYKCST